MPSQLILMDILVCLFTLSNLKLRETTNKIETKLSKIEMQLVRFEAMER